MKSNIGKGDSKKQRSDGESGKSVQMKELREARQEKSKEDRN